MCPLPWLGYTYIETSAQDEIDALASSRSHSAVDSGTHEGVLFSLLNEMDGVEELVGVTVIGATNRPEVLVSLFHPRRWVPYSVSHIENAPRKDPALMRPGRLDRILYVGPPDLAGRVDILRIRTRNMAVDPTLDLDALAALVRSFPLTEVETSFYNFRLFCVPDERVLGRRAYGYVPRGRNDRHARRFKCDICESSTFLRKILILILEIFRSNRVPSSLQRKPSSDRSHPRCCENLSAGIMNTASICWRKSPFPCPERGPRNLRTGTTPRAHWDRGSICSEKPGSEGLLYVVNSRACSGRSLPMRS